MTTSPTFRQIKAQLSAIRKKIPNARSIAMRTKAKWTGNIRQVDGDDVFLIHQCDSPLAMRLALRGNDANATTVIITDLDDHEIGDDILVRLRPRKVVPLDSWQIVKSMFQARTIDPRITCHPWVAELLIELIPPEGFPPAPSGFLDADTVWAILLKRVVGLDAERPDLIAFLKWSSDASNVARFHSATPAFRAAASEWLVSSVGPAIEAVLRSVNSSERPEAMSIGLAAGVVFHEQAKGRLEKAAAKLEERYLGGISLPQHVIERWAGASTEVLRLQLNEPRLKQQILQRTDEILCEVGAEAFAHLSDTSPMGFDRRMAEFGKRLSESLSPGSHGKLEPLFSLRRSISQHEKHTRERRRLERVDMALRLIRWVNKHHDADEPKSLTEAANDYLSEGGFIDWARLVLRSGDPVRELSEAYATLFNYVTAIRERRSRRFAELLRDWTAVKTTDERFIPVEEVLERVVAPIAAQKPVLLIVIDGMSVAVFRELMADVLGQDWSLVTEDAAGMRLALAVVPSVTEVSRSSLLSGRLTQGNSATEKTAFAEHPALLRASRSGFAPVLFHKATLQELEDGGLAAEIRKEIGSAHRKIVGVVINAVDDHLLKGEQIDTRWSRDEIKVLPVLLHEAKTAGRTVILVSDHGHVLDCNTKQKAFKDCGERWRPDEGNEVEGELTLRGPRVVIPASKRLIAPWTEELRYGIKKNGYHGGISPQEMVIPIAVLSGTGDIPPGWSEAKVDVPDWWDLDSQGNRDRPRPLPDLKPQKPKEKPAVTLFPLDEDLAPPKPQAVAAEVNKKQPEWISVLLSSPVFEEQKQLGGRAVPGNEVISRMLNAIDERGGKITSLALARAIDFSPMRLRGLLAVAQRILNVDGFPVLNRDEASDTVELDRALLCRQFDLV